MDEFVIEKYIEIIKGISICWKWQREFALAIYMQMC